MNGIAGHKRLIGNFQKINNVLLTEVDINDARLAREVKARDQVTSFLDVLECNVSDGQLFEAAREHSLRAYRAGIDVGIDIGTATGRDSLRQLVRNAKPYLIVMGFAESTWSVMNRRINASTPAAKQRLADHRADDKAYLALIAELAFLQADEGRYFLITGPSSSEAWKQSVITSAKGTNSIPNTCTLV